MALLVFGLSFLFLLGVFVVAVSRPAGAFVWVLGSRSLPRSWFPFVSRVVAAFARSGLGVASGGALGADLFALRALLAVLPSLPSLPAGVRARVRSSSLVSAAWCSFVGFPRAVRPVVSQASRLGVPVAWGSASPGCPRGCFGFAGAFASLGGLWAAGWLRCFCWVVGGSRVVFLVVALCAARARVRGLLAFVRVAVAARWWCLGSFVGGGRSGLALAASGFVAFSRRPSRFGGSRWCVCHRLSCSGARFAGAFRLFVTVAPSGAIFLVFTPEDADAYGDPVGDDT